MMSTTGLGLRDCFVIFLELSYVSHYCVGHHLQNVHSSYFFLSNSAFGVASYLLLFREKFKIVHYLDTSIAYYCFRCFSDMMYYFIIFSWYISLLIPYSFFRLSEIFRVIDFVCTAVLLYQRPVKVVDDRNVFSTDI